jgi:hypothetical protein
MVLGNRTVLGRNRRRVVKSDHHGVPEGRAGPSTVLSPPREDRDLPIDFAAPWDAARQRESFVVGEHDFADLEVRAADSIDNFHFFFDPNRRTLIRRFVLGTTQQTETYCVVTLIEGDTGYQPRLDVRRDNTSNAARGRAEFRIADGHDGHLVKAGVDLSDYHEAFWELAAFLSSFPGVAAPAGGVAVLAPADAVKAFTELARNQDRDELLGTLRTVVEGRLTDQDVHLLVDRKAALDQFKQLLDDDEYLDAQVANESRQSVEGVWQAFFERNQWIFGYGLQLVACSGLDDTKLEAITTGADAFTGAGDRVDALMSTHGHISSMMFVEIKRADTDLLAGRRDDGEGHTTYRSGVYIPSRELVGAVSQVSVIAHRVTRKVSDLHDTKDDHGYKTGQVGTVEPRRVVVAGKLSEFMHKGTPHEEEFRSFELYRQSIPGVDIITFDELHARARYIVAQDDARAGT